MPRTIASARASAGAETELVAGYTHNRKPSQDATEADSGSFLDHVYPPLPLPTHEAGTEDGVTYKTFDKEDEMAAIVALIDKDLSEPYSILTYRYFVYNWAQHTVRSDVKVGKKK